MFALDDKFFENEINSDKYDNVPDVVEYQMPDLYDMLPFVRCPGCGKVINSQSTIARQALDELQAERQHDTGHGMDTDYYNSVIGDVIKKSGLSKGCCTMDIIEQMVIPKRPTYIDRYIQDAGTVGNIKKTSIGNIETVAVGNVKIEYISGPDRKSYNPYSFNIRDLASSINAPEFESEDSESDDSDSQDSSDPPITKIMQSAAQTRIARYKLKETLNKDIYPSMPEIDSTFEEETYFKESVLMQSGKMVVAGLIRTGVPNYESVLIKGTSVIAR